tara:strand:- start:708 stop:2462 length:1755 start_codon:yes stop_codon:yes gene_type:complete
MAGAAVLGAIVKRSVQTSAEFEKLQTRLIALKGSVAAGTQAFESFNKIAKTTPFQLQNVVEAGAQLEAFGADSEKTLKSVADLAAFMGTDIVDAANAFGRAFAGGAGAADVLRDRGVLTQVKLKSGFDDLSKLTLPEFRKALEDTLTDPEGNIAGATDLLAATFSGLVSNFQDSLAQLQDGIGDLLAPSIKRILLLMKDGVDDLTESFKRMGETQLETTIRLLKEAGVNVDELVIANKELELSQLRQLTSETDMATLKAGIKQDEADIESTRTKILNLQKETNKLTGEETMTIKVASGRGDRMVEQQVSIKELKEAQIRGLFSQLDLEAESIANHQNLIKKLIEIGVLEADIAQLRSGEDDGSIVEKAMTQEEIKTAILLTASEERKRIQEEEKISALSIEDFKAAVNALKTTEEQKTKIISDEIKKRKKAEDDAHKKRIEQNLESAILSGQSAKEAAISVVKAEIAEAQAGLISSIMTSVPFPLNLALAAGAGSMIGKVTDQLFSSFATGGSFITKGRTTLPIGNGVVVGDNASGMERIDVTPLPSPTSSGGNITINISAPLVDETVVETIIPAIRRAEKLNL